jgi:hypothetical protein
MPAQPKTKTIFKVPESNETIDNTITSKKSDVQEIEKYREFIKRTTGYEPMLSDIFNQGAMFFISRDTVYQKHLDTGRANKASSSSKANMSGD